MKYIRIVLIIGAILGISYMAWQVYLYIGRGSLSVTVSPKDATATIDGKAYDTKTMQSITLKPGDHALRVALDGFKPVEQAISMGWQDSQSLSYKLQPKSFKAIYQNLAPDIGSDDFDAVREKFFLNNTWAAAYIVSGTSENDISVAVINRSNGAWRLVYHNYRTEDDAKKEMPAEVYDYIKDFKE